VAGYGCVAVDASGNAVFFYGHSVVVRAIDPKGGGLTAVSCPAIDDCVATDFDGGIVSFHLR
jgi:hypothetical protein